MAKETEEIKGLFTPAQEKKLGKLADQAVKLKNPIAEAVDGPVFTGSIRALDNLVFERLPERLKVEVREYTSEIIDSL